MLPLYVFLVITLIYFGTFHQLNLKVLKVVTLFSQTPDQQTEAELPEALEQDKIAGFPTAITDLVINDATISDLFEEDDMLSMFNENTFSVSGHHSLEGQTIVYSTRVDDTPWTKTIEKYRLADLTQTVENEMSYWLERVSTSIEVTMELPFHSSGNEGRTEINFDMDQHLEVVVTHNHEDVIRVVNPLDEQPNKRYTHKERQRFQNAYPNLALDRFISDGWELPNVDNTWSVFWNTETQPNP